MKPIELYLVRHGETELNKLNKVQGWVDSPLTENGLEIARLCGLGLKDIAFDVAYSSDLMRAVKTTEVILKQNKLKGISHHLRRNLREVSFGSFGGKDKNTYKRACSKRLFGEEDLSLLDKQMETRELTLKDLINTGYSLDTSGEAEDYTKFIRRLVKEVEGIFLRAEKMGDEKILVVDHGIAIFALLNELSGSSVSSISDVENASVSLLTYKNSSIVVEAAASMEYVSNGKKVQNI